MPSTYPVLRTHRPTIVQPEPLTIIGGHGGVGGDDGGDGGDGGGGEGGGGGGGDGGECFATKDTVSSCLHGFLQREVRQRFGKEKVSPNLGAVHRAPFQPSPHVSIMVRVHVAPIVTAKGELDV